MSVAGPPARGFDRIDAVLTAVEEGARSTAAVSRHTGLHRATAHRLVKDLSGRGYLAMTPAVGLILGPRIMRMAATALRDLPLRVLAQPVLEHLSAATGESAQLYLLAGDRRICVASVASDSELRTIVEVGATLPLTAGSAGKVFLAYLPPAEREALVAQARAVTDRTPIGEQLQRQLLLVRQRGWATSSGEREPGVGSVSAPIRDELGAVAGVISVSAPTTRLTRGSTSRYAAAVLDAARELERMLGTQPEK